MSTSLSLDVNLKDSLKMGNVANAYIFELPAGKQRDGYIRAFAKTLLCENSSEGYCGCCASCIRIDKYSHEDVIYLRTENRTQYSVKDVLPFAEKLSFAPYGRYRLGIIENGEMLREDSQNKLLKLIEEPEPGVVLVIAVDNRQKLLDTIRSRCVLVRALSTQNEELLFSEDESIESFDNLGRLLSKGQSFSDYRSTLFATIKSRDEALEFLDYIEKKTEELLLRAVYDGETHGESGKKNVEKNGKKSTCPGEFVRRINAIETARVDMLSGGGMDYKLALKRLYLEFNDRLA